MVSNKAETKRNLKCLFLKLTEIEAYGHHKREVDSTVQQTETCNDPDARFLRMNLETTRCHALVYMPNHLKAIGLFPDLKIYVKYRVEQIYITVSLFVHQHSSHMLNLKRSRVLQINHIKVVTNPATETSTP